MDVLMEFILYLVLTGWERFWKDRSTVWIRKKLIIGMVLGPAMQAEIWYQIIFIIALLIIVALMNFLYAR